MVNPLINKLRDQILVSPEEALKGKRVQRIARLLYFITKVRGAKVVRTFLGFLNLSLVEPKLI